MGDVLCRKCFVEGFLCEMYCGGDFLWRDFFGRHIVQEINCGGVFVGDVLYRKCFVEETFFGEIFVKTHIVKRLLKGTGTRDLIWLKVVSLDRSWLVGLTDDL